VKNGIVLRIERTVNEKLSAYLGVPGEFSVTSARVDYFDLRLRATFLAALEACFTRRFLATGEDFIVRTIIPKYKSEVVQPSRKSGGSAISAGSKNLLKIKDVTPKKGSA
jgi:hypothetical protein